MSRTVIWSDALQEGYMSLTNLPANDPGAKQEVVVALATTS
jgi:hypothetical protein